MPAACSAASMDSLTAAAARSMFTITPFLTPCDGTFEKPIISKLSDTTTSYSLSFAVIRDYEDYDEEEKEENVEMFFWD